MDFVLNDEQVSLQQELRRFLDSRVTSDARRAAAAMPGGVDRGLFGELGSMGVFGLVLPEQEGGVGLGLTEAVIVFEELGRTAVPGPVIATFLAAGAVDGAAQGDVVGLVTADEPALVEHLDGLDVLLVLDGSEVRLAAELPAGRAVDRPLDPLTPVSVVDRLPAVGDRLLDGDEARRTGGLLAAAMQVGLGQAALELGVEYAKQREQFGRTIGSFQAVKHLLADAAVAVETARAGVQAAAVTLDEGGEAGRLVPGARVVASHAADRSARACIQVHGGMGFTWELDAHLFLKRAMVLDVAFGGTEAALDQLAAAL